MRINGDEVLFSSGKNLYAYNGIIGLSPVMDVTGGYDQRFYDQPTEDDDFEPSLTKEEQIELADYMIAAWQKFREKAIENESVEG